MQDQTAVETLASAFKISHIQGFKASARDVKYQVQNIAYVQTRMTEASPAGLAVDPCQRPRGCTCAVVCQLLYSIDMSFVDPEARKGSWFQPSLTEQQAVSLLSGHRDGVFVVRTTPSGALVLSYVFQGLIENWLLMQYDDGKCGFKRSPNRFRYLSQLVYHYIHAPSTELQCPLDPNLRYWVEKRRWARRARAVNGRASGVVVQPQRFMPQPVPRQQLRQVSQSYRHLVIRNIHHHQRHRPRRVQADYREERRFFQEMRPQVPVEQDARSIMTVSEAPMYERFDEFRDEGAIGGHGHEVLATGYDREETRVERTYVYTDVSETCSSCHSSRTSRSDGEPQAIEDWQVTNTAPVTTTRHIEYDVVEDMDQLAMEEAQGPPELAEAPGQDGQESSTESNESYSEHEGY